MASGSASGCGYIPKEKSTQICRFDHENQRPTIHMIPLWTTLKGLKLAASMLGFADEILECCQSARVHPQMSFAPNITPSRIYVS